MKVIFLFMLLPTLCFGQAVDTVDWNAFEYRDDRILFKSGKPFTGVIVDYYGNGQKNYEENYKDGKEDGLFTKWYVNGQKMREENYKDGKKDGLFTEWYGNGQKRSEGNYKDGLFVIESLKEWDENVEEAEIVEEAALPDYYVSEPDLEERRKVIFYKMGSGTPFTGVKTFHRVDNGKKMREENYKDGQQDGLFTEWYENGQKEREGNYKDGMREGLWTEWYNNGKKKSEVDYRSEEEKSRKEWYEEEALPDSVASVDYVSEPDLEERRKVIFYKVGSDTPFTGVKTFHWVDNGQKMKEENFKDGMREGLWTEWNDNKQKEVEGNYKDGMEEGLWTWYHWRSNKKMREENYKDGRQDGLFTEWYESGQKESEGNYKNGKQEGLWTIWHENGQKMIEENYKDGELISRKEWDENGKEIKN